MQFHSRWRWKENFYFEKFDWFTYTRNRKLRFWQNLPPASPPSLHPPSHPFMNYLEKGQPSQFIMTPKFMISTKNTESSARYPPLLLAYYTRYPPLLWRTFNMFTNKAFKLERYGFFPVSINKFAQEHW